MFKNNVSPTNNDESENERTVIRNPEQKTFGGFVDKVLQQIPVTSASQRRVKLGVREDNDPVAVLHNRGLLNIVGATLPPERSSSSEPDSSSEIDLTFYTREFRLGEVVKGFYSNHHFRNGELVYSTTKEISPQLPQDIKKFSDWWKYKARKWEQSRNPEAKPGMANTNPRKNLADIVKDIQREEIIKRYESASGKSLKIPPQHARQGPKRGSPRRKEYKRIDPKVNYSDSMEELKDLLHGFHDSDNSSLELQNVERCENANSNPQRVTYRATWKHRSPKKPTENCSESSVRSGNSASRNNETNPPSIHRKTSQHVLEEDVPVHKIGESILEPNDCYNSPKRCTQSEEILPHKPKASAPECKKCSSTPGIGQSENYRKSFTSRETDEVVRRYSQHHGRRSKKDFSYIDAWLKDKPLSDSNKMDLGPARPTSSCPIIAEADIVHERGDAEHFSTPSDAHTSVCSLDYINEYQDCDAAKLQKETKAKLKQHYDSGHRKARSPYREATRSPPNAQYFTNKNAKMPIPPRNRTSPHKSVQFNSSSESFQSTGKKNSNLQCYAACHKQTHGENVKVTFMKESFSKPIITYECSGDHEYDELTYIKKFVNEEALKDYSRKYYQSSSSFKGDRRKEQGNR